MSLLGQSQVIEGLRCWLKTRETVSLELNKEVGPQKRGDAFQRSKRQLSPDSKRRRVKTAPPL